MKRAISSYVSQHIIWSFLAPFGTAVLFFSCAQIVNPSGGPADAKPPYALKYSPDSAKTNFTSRNISILFDEYIQLNDLQKQLVISPPMIIHPEIKVKGRALLIEIKDTLKKNTTYTFNFGNSIRDITENNALDNFQYIFSTGSYIDSLSLSGTVRHSFDMKAEKGILVMLYSNHSDSVPYKNIPACFAKTKEDGSYKIENIRSGTYKAFALKDVNANYIYDLPTESIAFSDTLIEILKHAVLDLSLFNEEAKDLKLKKFYIADIGRMNFVFSKPIEDISIVPISLTAKQKVFFKEMYPSKDTVSYWYKHEENDDTVSLRYIVNKNMVDTVKFCGGCVIKKTRGRGPEANKLIVKLNASKEKPFNHTHALQIKFNHPIQHASANSIVLYAHSRKTNFKEAFFIDSIRKNFIFKFPFLPDSSYRLFIPPNTFTDIFGLTNDSLLLDFKTQEEKYYGTLKLNLKMKFGPEYLLQLINEKGDAFDYATSDKSIFTYSFLPPGSYKLKIIYDKNKDGKWTTGNYSEKKKPETVIYYPGAVTIRSNWDLELDWTP